VIHATSTKCARSRGSSGSTFADVGLLQEAGPHVVPGEQRDVRLAEQTERT
jgi:hypothetical protein